MGVAWSLFPPSVASFFRPPSIMRGPRNAPNCGHALKVMTDVGAQQNKHHSLNSDLFFHHATFPDPNSNHIHDGGANDVATFLRDESDRRLEMAFHSFDYDHSGTICRSELRDILRALGHNPDEEKVNDLMARVS